MGDENSEMLPTAESLTCEGGDLSEEETLRPGKQAKYSYRGVSKGGGKTSLDCSKELEDGHNVTRHIISVRSNKHQDVSV